MTSAKLSFSGIGIPDLPEKPRAIGLTAILDKGLGPLAVGDLVASAANWIDVVKLGWGTSRLQPAKTVRQKIEAYHAGDIRVCTGGTLLEVAYAQDRVAELLAGARELDFDLIEVSNGVHPMSFDEKLGLIAMIRQAGFEVWSEVGKKNADEDRQLGLETRFQAIRRELDAGAGRVVLEGRESGTVGIYDGEGRPAIELLERVVDEFGTERLVFEAPRKSQQVWLMQAFGFDLNFGNIPPDDAVSLATLRTGLRGDTFADIHLAGVPVYLDVGVHGALEARERGGVVVLIDALRASATIVTALGCGMRAVRPVASPEECVGEITAGERGGRKLPHVRHANSPTELESCNYTGKTLVLTSTNGVECLLTVAGPSTAVLVGSTINRTAVAREAYARARDQGVSITLLMAGRNNRPAREDSLAAGEILRAMPGPVHLHGLAPAASDGLEAEFFDCESGRNLVELGYSADVRRCAQVDLYEAVPVLAAGELVLSDWSG